MRAADARQYLHALSGGGAFLLYYFPGPAVAALVAAGAVFAAVVSSVRQKSIQSHRPGAQGKSLPTRLHRPHETAFRSGATTYAVGVIAAILLFPREAAFVGWLTLASGDSAATLIGSKWPILRLRRGGGRSLGGLVGFAAAAFLVTVMGVAWWSGGLSPQLFLRAGIVAVACAVAETFISNVDDNFYLPSAGAALYWLIP